MLAGGCGGADGPSQLLPGARWRWVLAPAAFAEINLLLSAGENATVTYRSNAAVSWDVHRHVNGHVLVGESGNSVARTITVVGQTRELVSVMWTHTGSFSAPVTVEVALSSGTEVYSATP